MVYGSAVPTLTSTVSGFVNGDTSSVVSGAPELSTIATSKSHVAGSPYPIDVAMGTLSTDDDYRFDLVGGELDVNARHTASRGG